MATYPVNDATFYTVLARAQHCVDSARGTENNFPMPFECRLCHHDRYRQIVVLRPKGPYQTPFFACQQCGVMFTDPAVFSTQPLNLVTEVSSRRNGARSR